MEARGNGPSYPNQYVTLDYPAQVIQTNIASIEESITSAALSTGVLQAGSVLDPKPLAGGQPNGNATTKVTTLTYWNGPKISCASPSC